MTTDKGEIIIIENGTLDNDTHTFNHRLSVKVKYDVNSTLQLMSYVVIIDDEIVKEVTDAKYSYEELHLAGALAIFRKMYFGLPDLKLHVERGELSNPKNGIMAQFTG